MSTHPDFQSFVPYINNLEDMKQRLQHVEDFQQTIQCMTQNQDHLPGGGDPHNFRLRLEEVDRLYDIRVFNNPTTHYKVFLGRVSYNNTHIFVQMCVKHCFNGFYCQCGIPSGFIYLSCNANNFFQVAVEEDFYNRDVMFESLCNDNYIMNHYYIIPRPMTNMKYISSKMPTLTFLTHIAINKYRKTLDLSLLPTILLNSVTDYNKISDAAAHYDRSLDIGKEWA
ncbi:hypothetical protein Pcinc_012166 [Petrolisthes cinctipes]|uniref:Uncharacterized protein n=1 Tax=Petrolisthes cinctipes TaxID=88211 RepID=A0AAE1G1R0_PETCI|nr:hypothetical protein Pcinc_012166 [Petrolisthes cinctipes]